MAASFFAGNGLGQMRLTIIAAGATPDDEREFGVEGVGKRSRNFLAA